MGIFFTPVLYRIIQRLSEIRHPLPTKIAEAAQASAPAPSVDAVAEGQDGDVQGPGGPAS